MITYKFSDNSQLVDYLKLRGSRHRLYNHYLIDKYLKSCLNDKCLYLSDGSRWEDLLDSDNFNNDGELKRYGYSFAIGENENIALWKEYSNIVNNDGYLISFPKAFILDLIRKTNDVILGYFADNKFIEKTHMNVKNIYLADMYYINRSAKNLRATIGEEHYEINNKVYNGTIHLSKSYPWKFENECRLIVEVENNTSITNCHFLKINLSDDQITEIKKYIVSGPTNKPEKYNSSQLKGTVKFKR